MSKTQPNSKLPINLLDEVCKCGKLRREHEDTVATGHGPCWTSRCPRFTWVAPPAGGYRFTPTS